MTSMSSSKKPTTAVDESGDIATARGFRSPEGIVACYSPLAASP